MPRILVFVAGLSFACLSLAGCSTMLPVSKTNVESSWETFEEAKAAFDKIIPYQTTRADLAALHFDPFKTPNIEILTYLDILKHFMSNASIKLEDMDLGVQECIGAGERCQAYEIKLRKIRSERYGSVFLDLFRFKRQTHQTGWYFTALVVMVDDVVVYKLWSGKPQIDEDLYRKNPLGPLQEPADVATDAAILGTF
ncbi:MAG TPA: hypothetical protein VLL73_06510 [Desulfurivibrionaceae bacterium]|nr:hypothetical protein [Desulfurivibrionaceae bacterium]